MKDGGEVLPAESVEPDANETQQAYKDMLRAKSAEINARKKNYPDESAQLRGAGYLALDFTLNMTRPPVQDEQELKDHQVRLAKILIEVTETKRFGQIQPADVVAGRFTRNAAADVLKGLAEQQLDPDVYEVALNTLEILIERRLI
jgi:hypothetical protein